MLGLPVVLGGVSIVSRNHVYHLTPPTPYRLYTIYRWHKPCQHFPPLPASQSATQISWIDFVDHPFVQVYYKSATCCVMFSAGETDDHHPLANQVLSENGVSSSLGAADPARKLRLNRLRFFNWPYLRLFSGGSKGTRGLPRYHGLATVI